jgi:hypothetical protein
MKIYIANGTGQIQHFCYRVPGPSWEKRFLEVEIPQGMQILIPGDFITPEDGEVIVEQIHRYGGVRADEVDKTKPFAGLCYSIDKPVSPPKIEKLFQHNKKVMEKQAEDGLLATALGNNKILKDRIEETAREARHAVPEIKLQDISITEVPRSGSPRKTNFFSNGKDKAGTIRMGNA